jgi:SOS-response transcriptional repressor LexA
MLPQTQWSVNIKTWAIFLEDFNMDFGQRLKSLRAERNLTQQNLGDAVGVSTVTIRAWERNAKKPAMDALLSLGRALNISIDTLLDFHLENTPNYALVLTSAEKKLLSSYQALDNYGKKAVDAICVLEKERVDAAKTIRVIPKVIDFRQVNSERFIPRYTTPSAAGSSVPLDGVDFEMILVDSSVPEEADYAVYIQGNSMYPYIHDGDMVYVKKDAELSVGDVGIFCVDGAMYCKQYYLDDNNNLVLVSANPELRHTNIFVSADSGRSVKACGKVLLKEKIDLPDYLFEN